MNVVKCVKKYEKSSKKPNALKRARELQLQLQFASKQNKPANKQTSKPKMQPGKQLVTGP